MSKRRQYALVELTELVDTYPGYPVSGFIIYISRMADNFQFPVVLDIPSPS